MSLKYYFCDSCNIPSDTSICPNCFMPARELNPEEECIECGNPLGECTCANERDEYRCSRCGRDVRDCTCPPLKCPVCGSSDLVEDDYSGDWYCPDCGEFFSLHQAEEAAKEDDEL